MASNTGVVHCLIGIQSVRSAKQVWLINQSYNEPAATQCQMAEKAILCSRNAVDESQVYSISLDLVTVSIVALL